MQKERNDKGLCTRCGRRDHKWYHCTGKIVVAAESSTAAASEGGKKKRKRKQEQDSSRDDGETEMNPTSLPSERWWVGFHPRVVEGSTRLTVTRRWRCEKEKLIQGIK